MTLNAAVALSTDEPTALLDAKPPGCNGNCSHPVNASSSKSAAASPPDDSIGAVLTEKRSPPYFSPPQPRVRSSPRPAQAMQHTCSPLTLRSSQMDSAAAAASSSPSPPPSAPAAAGPDREVVMVIANAAVLPTLSHGSTGQPSKQPWGQQGKGDERQGVEPNRHHSESPVSTGRGPSMGRGASTGRSMQPTGASGGESGRSLTVGVLSPVQPRSALPCSMHATPHHSPPRHATPPRHTTPRHTTPCHHASCHAMPHTTNHATPHHAHHITPFSLVPVRRYRQRHLL